MIPPLLRRCPNCGYAGLTTGFATVESEDGRLLECPSCGHRFEVRESPWLAALGFRS